MKGILKDLYNIDVLTFIKISDKVYKIKTIDKEYALTTDVTKPIVLFEIPNESLFIADGNHRLYRAATEHIRRMNAVIIPQEIHLSYLYQSSVDLYYRVIEGLRSEGIFINNFAQR